MFIKFHSLHNFQKYDDQKYAVHFVYSYLKKKMRCNYFLLDIFSDNKTYYEYGWLKFMETKGEMNVLESETLIL